MVLAPFADGTVVPLPVERAFAEGSASAVPLLIGFTRDAANAAMRAALPPDLPVSQVRTDLTFRGPSLALADSRAAHQLPTWLYRFDWSSTRSAFPRHASTALEGRRQQPAPSANRPHRLYFGPNNICPNHIRRTHAVTPVSALRYEHSVFERGVEKKILPVRGGWALVPYSPARSRFLTGVIRPSDQYPTVTFPAGTSAGRERDTPTTCAQSSGSVNSPPARASPRPSSRWPDGSPKARTSSRSRHPQTERHRKYAGAADVELSRSDLDRLLEILPNGSAGSSVQHEHMASRRPAAPGTTAPTLRGGRRDDDVRPGGASSLPTGLSRCAPR